MHGIHDISSQKTELHAVTNVCGQGGAREKGGGREKRLEPQKAHPFFFVFAETTFYLPLKRQVFSSKKKGKRREEKLKKK